MNEQWKNVVISKISAAVYVAPYTGKYIRKNRTFHGLVLNDTNVVRDYVFDDGYVMRVDGNAFFYLPKGSSYHVDSHKMGGCYVINFDAELCDKPFSVSFRNTEALLHNFKAACEAWKGKSDHANLLSMRALYDGIYQMQKEEQKQYISGSHLSLIAPAIQEINRSFTENELSISKLAALCGISEVYFRRLFLNAFGISPKEYITQKRIEYAKILLSSGDFLVSEVGILCGYAEPCHFSREFSRRVGMMPSRYLEK
jgi:AraC-like DNA-binding protein